MTELSPKASNLLIVTPDQNPLLVSPGPGSQEWKTNVAGIGGRKFASTHYSHFDGHLVVDAAPPVTDCTNKSGRIFKYVISPEDTTNKADDRQSETTTYQTLNIFSILKTMLWMAVSIGLSLLIGNFC